MTTSISVRRARRSTGMALAAAVLGGLLLASTNAQASTQTVTRITAGYEPSEVAVSANGDYVAFVAELTPTRYNPTSGSLLGLTQGGPAEVYVYDVRGHKTSLVSASNGGQPSNGACDAPSLSDDGQLVAFACKGSNLVPGDNNNVADVFVKNMKTGRIELVDHDINGKIIEYAGTIASDQSHNTGAGFLPAISGDGSTVAWWSNANVLHDAAPLGYAGVPAFLYGLYETSLRTGRVSAVTSVTKGPGKGLPRGNFTPYFPPVLSRDGNRVAYLVSEVPPGTGGDQLTTNPDEGDGNWSGELILRNMLTHQAILMNDRPLTGLDRPIPAPPISAVFSGLGPTAPPITVQPTMSESGALLAYCEDRVSDPQSNSGDGLPQMTGAGWASSIWMRPVASGSWRQADGTSDVGDTSMLPELSPDGHYLGYASVLGDVYLKNLKTGVTTQVVKHALPPWQPSLGDLESTESAYTARLGPVVISLAVADSGAVAIVTSESLTSDDPDNVGGSRLTRDPFDNPNDVYLMQPGSAAVAWTPLP